MVRINLTKVVRYTVTLTLALFVVNVTFVLRHPQTQNALSFDDGDVITPREIDEEHEVTDRPHQVRRPRVQRIVHHVTLSHEHVEEIEEIEEMEEDKEEKEERTEEKEGVVESVSTCPGLKVNLKQAKHAEFQPHGRHPHLSPAAVPRLISSGSRVSGGTWV